MKALSLLAFGAALGITSVAWADFFEDFDTDTSANWIVLTSDGQTDHEANFSLDYFNDRSGFDIFGNPITIPGFKIPSAPNSTGGTTKGLLLRTNLVNNASASIVSGLSTSAIGQVFTGNFVMTADVWLNYLGPGPVGGSGTTQLAAMGWGTEGTVAQTNANSLSGRDSVFLATTLDGGSAVDWRIYAKDSRFTVANGYYYGAGNSSTNVVSGVYASGDTGANLNSAHSYWSTAYPSIALPADQALNYPSQTGTTNPGSVGFKWRVWKVTKTGDTLTFHIDDVLIGTVDLTFCTVSANPNLLVAMMDSNGNAAVDSTGLNFMLVDNLRVTMTAPDQHVTGTLSLGDTVGTFGFARNISYDVMQGTTVLASGSVVANSPNTSFDVDVPAAATGAATIVWNGSSFLRRHTAVSLTGSNQAVGNVMMQNGDVDESGEVDAADIDQVIADFGSTSDINSDTDANGEVDAADIDIVIANFGGTDDV
ncbi:MAG: hypothetical protein JNK63_09205 [Chthonomonas sp.]|nr:hypothetical protein [Chthonomonas sp.]